MENSSTNLLRAMSSAHTHTYTQVNFEQHSRRCVYCWTRSSDGSKECGGEGIKCLQFGWCNWRKAAAFATPFVVGIFLIQKHQTKPSLLPWLGYLVVAVVALINAQCGTWRIRNTAELHLPHAHFACTKSNNSSSMNERSMCPHTHRHTHTHAVPHTHT